MLRRLRIDVPTTLSRLYAPLQPIVKRLRVERRGTPRHEPADIHLPAGYRIEVVADGLTAPVHVCFDPEGAAYVTESGHKSDSAPRVVRIDVATGERRTVADLTERWTRTGAATGAAWHEGALFVSNTDEVLRVDPERGSVEEVVTGLPGRGDHQTNHPLIGPDGRLYWGQGSVTNLGVVGADNFGYEWLPSFPQVHDVPGGDVELAGRSYSVPDVLNGNPLRTVESAAFLPYGTAAHAGQVIAGDARASGAVLSCRTDGDDLRVVAWGLRNPYGLAFDAEGRLWATEHGSDERGARFIIGDPDDLYEVREGAWYGWPDFASGVRLDDPRWGEGGTGREPDLARFPDPAPPPPLVSFEPHVGANGLDVCRDAAFGFEGQAFVALFGDVAPLTTPRQVVPAGFKVVRVDLERGEVHDFAVNRRQGPASKLFHGGFERPSHCAFGPDGALYVVDFGEINIAPEKGGIRMRQGTGVVWRILREPGVPADDEPAPATRVPLYPIQAAALVGIAAAALVAVRAVLRRLFGRR